jgi:hypothetical protein
MKDLIGVLLRVRSKITDESDMLWIYFETPSDLRNEIDGFILQLEKEDISCLAGIHTHFMPTGTFQEHSLMNGWSKEYLFIATGFDKIYKRLIL